MTQEATLDFPLFHGTSSVFIKGILDHGLGGRNPIEDLKVLEFSTALFPIAQSHLGGKDNYLLKLQSFEMMVRQHKGSMNFEHGQTYLSPSRQTAVRYASNNSCGSEFLSAAVDFLRILWLQDVPGIQPLYQRYPQIFQLLDIFPAPILIEIQGVFASSLLNEYGGDPAENIRYLKEITEAEMFETLGQQTNFRLTSLVPPEFLKVSLVNLIKWHSAFPEYELYELTRKST